MFQSDIDRLETEYRNLASRLGLSGSVGASHIGAALQLSNDEVRINRGSQVGGCATSHLTVGWYGPVYVRIGLTLSRQNLGASILGRIAGMQQQLNAMECTNNYHQTPEQGQRRMNPHTVPH